jgi:regulator of sigma E protease
LIDALFFLVAFVVAIGILIVVHEFGHFWVAKTLGVKVLRFSIGFGKPLWSRRFGRDRTELVIAAVPLGGYVKMLDESEGRVAKRDVKRAFNRQPLINRTAVVVAGPLFNFLFAILAYWVIFMAGIDGLKPVVGKVLEGSIAAQAGFQPDDELIAMDGKDVASWDHRRLYLFQKALDQESVAVEVRDRDGRMRTRVLDLRDFPAGDVNAALIDRGIGLTPFIPVVPPIIGVVEPGPAARAGLQIGDRITEVDGRPVGSWNELATEIGKNAGREITLVVERGDIRQQIVVTPDAVDRDGTTVGRINIRPSEADFPNDFRVKVRLGPLAAFGAGVENTWSMTWLTLEMLYKMLKLEVSSRNISGPITIAQYAGYSAKVGLTQFLMFLAVISISLGVLNLLPIPILDGGHLLYYVVEAIKGSPVSERVMIWGQQIGVMVLAGLMLLAFYNDLTRLFE